MNETLNPENRSDLVKYRLERAELSLKEAVSAAENGFFNAAINRLYYAGYYAASALLLSRNISATTHRGVKNMLNLHFNSEKELPRSTVKTFSILFESRQSGDYEDFIYYDEEDYERLYPRTVDFIEAMKSLV